MTPSRRLRISVSAVLVAVLTGCSAVTSSVEHTTGPPGPPETGPPSTGVAASSLLPGMPPVADLHNVYAAAGADMLSAAAKAAKPRVYVPHVKSGDVWVIDPATFAVVGKYRLGGELQHVIPSYDMTTLYASDDTTNKITPFDPRTGLPGANIPTGRMRSRSSSCATNWPYCNDAPHDRGCSGSTEPVSGRPSPHGKRFTSFTLGSALGGCGGRWSALHQTSAGQLVCHLPLHVGQRVDELVPLT